MPSTDSPKRTVLYARVSTDEQVRSGFSLAQQLEALREYTAQKGYEVLEEVTDPGQSGASLERPGMDRVRDLVAAGGVAVVLAQDRDRFAREPAYHYLLQREFEEYGTKLRGLNDRGDDSPEGQLTDGILDQLAKYEKAKIAERTRRGKIRKAREGKLIAVRLPNYGFRYNDARDNYVVDEERMWVVRRIFRMAGPERRSLYGIALALEAEGISSPTGNRQWREHVIRAFLEDDVYRPHTYEEVERLVSPEVAAKLVPEKRYGIWWFNQRRTRVKQISEFRPDGSRVYRKAQMKSYRPKDEWIAVPIPDAGIPRGWVDAAREAVRNSKKISANSHRFWQLSGGILRCAECGCVMATHSSPSRDKQYLHVYYRCGKRVKRRDACSNSKCHNGEELEARVWEAVSGVLKDPEQLRADLDAAIELERRGMRGDPDQEARLWADKLAEADRMRRGYQEQAAKGYMTLDELGAALEDLEETRKLAERELEALRHHREHLDALEQDRDALLDSLENIAPEALESLTPEHRHQLYKMLHLRVSAKADSSLEISGVFEDSLSVCDFKRTSPRGVPA
jgi:site-specific DNA recombinase